MSTTTRASAMYVIMMCVIVLARCASVADAQFIDEQRLDEIIELIVLLHFFQRDFLSIFIRQHEVAEVEVLTMVEIELGCEVVVFTVEGNFFFVCGHVSNLSKFW